MNIDAIKETLKARLDLFKLYILLIVGLITALSGIYIQETIEKRDIIVMIIGFIFLVVIVFFAIKTYNKIINLIKKLEI